MNQDNDYVSYEHENIDSVSVPFGNARFLKNFRIPIRT